VSDKETATVIAALTKQHVIEIERVWLLALIDGGSRAILGYTLCLRREYSRYDVIRTFERALTPAASPTQTIADLEPLQAGGFVSTALPETAYACWRTLRFDNARAHLAADSLDVACELLGCTVDAGPPTNPMTGPSLSASSVRSPCNWLIGCRVLRGRAAMTSYGSCGMCAVICA